MIRIAVRSAGALALATAGTLALAGTAAATPTPPDADEPVAADTSSVTLPLLGAPVVVDVTTDAGGGLVDVTLSASDALSTDRVHVNHVSFVNEDGSVKLRVAAAWGAERVAARAGTLADISGPGGWSGDVFDTGVVTDVAFTIGATAEGGPDITGITVNSPHEHSIGDVDHDAHGDHHSAKVAIEFSEQGQRRWLTIRASAPVEPDEGQAHVRVALSHPWGPRVADGDAVGAHTWNGTLCDGTAATVNYVVTDDGRITDVTASPDADVRSMGKFVWVGFDWFEGVSLFAHDRGEGLQVGAIEKIHCRPSAPTVNGEEIELDGRPGWPGRHGDGDGPWDGGRWGGWDGRGGWGHGHDDDDRDGRDEGDRDDGDDRWDGHRGPDGGNQWGDRRDDDGRHDQGGDHDGGHADRDDDSNRDGRNSGGRGHDDWGARDGRRGEQSGRGWGD